MITLTCPWCQDEAPMDIRLLVAAGGCFTCPACLTTVELVEASEVEMPLAA